MMFGWLQDEVGLSGGFSYRLVLREQRALTSAHASIKTLRRWVREDRNRAGQEGGGGASDCGERRCERRRGGRERCAESREQGREAAIGQRSDGDKMTHIEKEE